MEHKKKRHLNASKKWNSEKKIKKNALFGHKKKTEKKKYSCPIYITDKKSFAGGQRTHLLPLDHLHFKKIKSSLKCSHKFRWFSILVGI